MHEVRSSEHAVTWLAQQSFWSLASLCAAMGCAGTDARSILQSSLMDCAGCHATSRTGFVQTGSSENVDPGALFSKM